MTRGTYDSAASDSRDGSVSDPLTENDLSSWMVAYQSGEMAAFEKLHARLRPALRKYLLTLTLHAAHAEDLLQETFLQLHRSRHTYVPPRAVKPWAFGIARHVYLMDRRARARRHRHEVQEQEGLTELSVPAVLENYPQRDQLRRAIAALPANQREPLLLHHVLGFSFKEVGGILGLRAGTAKVRAHRAINQLREDLRKEDAA